MNKKYPCFSCEYFSYKYKKKYGHCEWIKDCILLLPYLIENKMFRHLPTKCDKHEEGNIKLV